MTYQLYGAALSPFVRKTRVFLLEKGQDYEAIHVDPFNLPDNYEELNPLKRIPVLQHGEHTLADSAVICSYLEQLHPEPQLYPESPYAYARCQWFEKFADYEIAPQTTFRVFRQRLLLPLFGQTCQEEEVQKALNVALPPLLEYLEGELQGQDYLVDNRLSVADIALACQFVNLEHGGESGLLDSWPNLKAHRERLLARDSFQQLLPTERAFVKKARESG